MTYVAPKLSARSFTCPHCGVLSQQLWSNHLRTELQTGAGSSGAINVEQFELSRCGHIDCEQWSIWEGEQMVYPIAANAPLPNEDLPESVRLLYQEARTIAQLSPRGAAALLRLAIQNICIELGETGKNLNDDIQHLVAKGLSVDVQRALDVVRVTGNHAVHPGTIDFDDSPQQTAALFRLVNMIANRMISEPKEAADLFNQLPEKDRLSIARRDGAE